MPQATLKGIIREVRDTPRVSTPGEVMGLMRNRFSNCRKSKKKNGEDAEADDGDDDGDEPDGDEPGGDGDDGDGAKEGDLVTVPHGDLAPEVPAAPADEKVVAYVVLNC